jgi:hypothetical protein
MIDVKDTLLKLLEWIGTSPLRLVMVITLVMFGMGVWFVYTEKDAFMASYRAQQALPKMNGKFEEATTFIMKKGDADLVAIFDVNPLLNTRKLVHLVVKSEGRIHAYDGMDVGLFTRDLANNRDVVALMSGEIPCSEYRRAQSFLGFFYIDKGMTYMCRISVPPDPSKFIGQITVGWKVQPADPDAMRIVVRVASEMLWN